MLAFPRLADKRLGPMIFWSIAIAVTAIACAALFYAGVGRTVNAAGPDLADPNDHFRRLLAGIEADELSGKLDAEQAIAAVRKVLAGLGAGGTGASPHARTGRSPR